MNCCCWTFGGLSPQGNPCRPQEGAANTGRDGPLVSAPAAAEQGGWGPAAATAAAKAQGGGGGGGKWPGLGVAEAGAGAAAVQGTDNRAQACAGDFPPTNSPSDAGWQRVKTVQFLCGAGVRCKNVRKGRGPQRRTGGALVGREPGVVCSVGKCGASFYCCQACHQRFHRSWEGCGQVRGARLRLWVVGVGL
jgi:hypothetical protein